MDRSHCSDDPGSMRRDLAERIRMLSRDEFGEDGSRCLATMLGLPHRTIRNYEGGRTIPGEVILAIIQITGVHPRWLLTGMEPMYLPPFSKDFAIARVSGASPGNKWSADGRARL